jgi:hypothetical protein
MTTIEKKVANFLADVNEFHNDIEMMNDAEFVYKYNMTKEEAANERILNTHKKIEEFLD